MYFKYFFFSGSSLINFTVGHRFSWNHEFHETKISLDDESQSIYYKAYALGEIGDNFSGRLC